MKNGIKELLELEAKIRYHDYLYFVADKPSISDTEYDQLVYRREELLKENPGYRPGLPPGFIEDNSGLKTVVIDEPMISVVKKKTRDDIELWRKRNVKGTVSYEEKLDGLSIRLVYRHGKLVQGHLRGTGLEGTDVTHRLHMLRDVPTEIPEYKDIPYFKVTGEGYCTYKDLLDYCEQWDLDPKETESRTTCSGIMKRLYPSERDTLYLYFKAYNVSKVLRDKVKTYPELRELMVNMGFDIPMPFNGSLLNELFSLKEKPDFGYAIDGIVVKDDDLSVWKDDKMQGYWNYAACYKFPTASMTTTLIGVEWGLTTKGYLTGTLIYEPVNYDGTTLRRAKFDYPDKYIKDGLRIGSVIQITKSNEIIPNIIGMKEAGTGKKVEFPKFCPCCNQPVVVESPSMVRCVNDSCVGLLISHLERLGEKKGLNILGLGSARITALVDSGYLSEPSDIFKITFEDYIKLDLVDENTARSIVDQVENSSSLPLQNWIFAACIPNIGYVRAGELADQQGVLFTELNTFLAAMKDQKVMEELFGLDGVVACEYVNNNENELVNFFIHYDFDKEIKVEDKLIPIGITGSWNIIRDQLTEQLAEVGYELADKVSKSITILLVGKAPSPGKIAKAEKWNIPVIEITPMTTFDQIVKKLRG